MIRIDSAEKLSKMFLDAGYNVDTQKAEIINDYLEDAGYQLATDNKNIFQVKFSNMDIEKTSLRDIVNFVESYADKQLNNASIERDEERSLMKDLGAIRTISSSVVKYYNYLLERQMSHDSAPGEFSKFYKEAVHDYSEEINPELNYEFYTRKSVEKMLEAGNFPVDNIKTVVSLYAPERVVKGPGYVEKLMKELQQGKDLDEGKTVVQNKEVNMQKARQK